MTIKHGLIKSLFLGAVCAAGLATAAPSEARTYYDVTISGGSPYYRDGYYDRHYYSRYDRPYYRNRHYRPGYTVAYRSGAYNRGRYRCYTEWDGDRVCYRRY